MFDDITPNLLAYLVLFGWPVVVFVLFKKLNIQTALISSILAGYLLLPSRLGLDMPLIPILDKTTIPSLACFLACLLFDKSRKKPATKISDADKEKANRVDLLYKTLLLFLFATPFVTVVTNFEPIIFGPTYIPGQSFYDAIGLCGLLLFTILPLLLGTKYLSTPESHITILKALCIAALLYSALVLLEVRLSPQLNRLVYGYFPHSFEQHIRNGGYRPIVFLLHGLWVGIFLCKATIASAILWKIYGNSKNGILYFYATIYLLLVLFASKNFGAFLIAIVVLIFISFSGVKRSLIISVLASILLVSYPLLRHYDVVPTQFFIETAAKINEERSRSLEYRVDMEDSLLERAMVKPVAGWGLWSRGAVYDPQTGQNLSVTDGIWIITISAFGWMGYLSLFGLLALPILTLYARRKKTPLPIATVGLSLVLAANLIDSIPNAALSPVMYLISGALIGYCRKSLHNSPSQEKVLPEKIQPKPRTPITRTRRS